MAHVNPDGSYASVAPGDQAESFNIRTVWDPRVDYRDQATMDKEYLAYIGASNWMRYVNDATEWNDETIKWTNLRSPGAGFLIDKKWFVEYDLKVSIHDIPVTSTQLYPFRGSESCIGFRAYPLNYVAESIILMLNNRTMTCNPHKYLYPRMEYWPQNMLKLSNGCCPHRKPNGQTFADMELRKNNSPFCSMAEFYDQDYPNTTVPTILSTTFVPGTVARGSNFERGSIPRSVKISNEAEWDPAKVASANKYKTKPTGAPDDERADDYAGEGNWGVSYLTYTAALAIQCYKKAKEFYKDIVKGTKYNNKVPAELMNKAKREAAEKALTAVKADTDMWDSGKTNEAMLKAFELTGLEDTWIDLDLVPAEFERGLLESYRAFYFEKGQKIATVFYYQNCCLTTGSYELIVRIREPVIAEPLDYTSSAEFGRCMWNINHFELKYTFSNLLPNMLMIDDYKLLANSDIFWLYNFNLQYIEGVKGNMNLLSDDHIKVHINAPPKLIYNCATPFVYPRINYVCQHKQFKRFEEFTDASLTVTADQLAETYIDPIKALKKPIKVISQNLHLSFHPNSIFIWVAQCDTDRHKSPDKFTRADSYAKITKLTMTYGNSGNLMAQYDDHELFQMSLRNGLQDRSYLDWCATMKNITTPTDFYGNASNLGWTGRRYVDQVVGGEVVTAQTEPSLNPAYNRYAGVGSVVRLIPGIDIVNGNGTNPLIAGMKSGQTDIMIECEFVPLNGYEATKYALNVMFEYDGVCTLAPGDCDLGMIAIESFEQLKSAPRARTFRESYAYGAGLGESVLRGLRLARNIMSNSGIMTKSRGSGFINSVGNLGKSAKMSGGKLISQSDLFRRY